MAVLKSLRTALHLIREQPILFVPMGIFALFQIPQLFFQSVDPVLSIVASLLFTGVFIFLTPMFYAGAIGMANDAAKGPKTSLSRFWAHVKNSYLSVLGAYLLITAVTFGFGIAISIAVFIAVVTVGLSGELFVTMAVAGFVLLFVLAFFVALFAVHFYAHAIVVEGKRAVDGLTRSIDVVRHNLKPVAGYGVLSLAFGAVMGGLYGLVTLAAFPSSPAPGEPAPTPELLPALGGSVGVVIVTALFATFFAVFSVVFYRELIGATDRAIEKDDVAETAVKAGSNDSSLVE